MKFSDSAFHSIVGVTALLAIIALQAPVLAQPGLHSGQFRIDFEYQVPPLPEFYWTGGRGIVTGDVRKDGILRIVHGDFYGKLHILHFDGSTYVKEWESVPPIEGVLWVAPMCIGDADNDGLPEILVHIQQIKDSNGEWANNQYFCVYKFNPGSATYGLLFLQNMGYGFNFPMVIADFNRDGLNEILAPHQSRFSVFTYDATGLHLQWSASEAFAMLQISVGDIDGDGYIEAITTSNQDAEKGKLHIYNFNGVNYQEKAEVVVSQEMLGSAGIGDLDGDGQAEIVTATYNVYEPLLGYQVFVIEYDGGSYRSAPVATHSVGMYAIYFGETDGDGRMEALICGNGDSALLEYNSGSYTLTSLGVMGAAIYGSASDVDGDGLAEFLFATYEKLFVVSRIISDTTPPVLTVPANTVVAEAISASGTPIQFSVSAYDAVDGICLVSCLPASGSIFPVGVSTVVCQAKDLSLNTATKAFNVDVRDTTPPVISPVDDLVFAATSPAGAVVTFLMPRVTDAVDPAPVVATVPPSGSAFPVGSTAVTVTAIDATGNMASKNFTVTVLSASQQISALLATVSSVFPQAANLLGNALEKLNAGQAVVSCNQLNAFINQVQAQSGKKLTYVQANQLIDAAKQIRAAIGCPDTP